MKRLTQLAIAGIVVVAALALSLSGRTAMAQTVTRYGPYMFPTQCGWGQSCAFDYFTPYGASQVDVRILDAEWTGQYWDYFQTDQYFNYNCTDQFEQACIFTSNVNVYSSPYFTQYVWFYYVTAGPQPPGTIFADYCYYNMGGLLAMADVKGTDNTPPAGPPPAGWAQEQADAWLAVHHPDKHLTVKPGPPAVLGPRGDKLPGLPPGVPEPPHPASGNPQ